jgi:hypothetical protein
LGFAILASGRDVTGSGSCIYDNGYYLIIKSYSSVVVVKSTTKAEPHQSLRRTIVWEREIGTLASSPAVGLG